MHDTIFMGFEEREKLWSFMKSKWCRMHVHILDQVVYIRYTEGLLNDIIILENIYNRIDEIEEMLTEIVLASTFSWYGIVTQKKLG